MRKKTTWKNNIFLLKKNNTNESRSAGILLSTITFLIVGGVLLLSYFLLNKPILTVIEASYSREKTFISYFQWRYQAPLFWASYLQPEDFRFCCRSYTYKNVQGAKEVFSIYNFLAEAPCHLKPIQLSSRFSGYEEAAWFDLWNKYLIYHENAIVLMNKKSACNLHLIERHLFIKYLTFLKQFNFLYI
jgi:hypothetical protein